MRFYLDTLGCQKNTVDSEALRQALIIAGHRAVTTPDQAEVMIVNTCGFIDVAKEQSIDRLVELSDTRREGQLLIAAGCLSQRYPEELGAELPELDAVIGVDAWRYLPDVLAKRMEGRRPLERLPVLPPGAAGWPALPRVVRGPTADVKIAEGCNYGCTFCSIPLMKGQFRSKPLESIVAEARQLSEQGVREAILVSQDSTAYGLDLHNGTDLATLLEALAADVPELPWIRVMYIHPDRLTHKLIQRLPHIPTFCHYVDIPMQHAHSDVLRRMRRGHNVERTEELIGGLRAALPDVAIRTTFITGFPGESEVEFEAMHAWLEKMRFDHVGVFTYSPEDGTLGAGMPDQVPPHVKKRRRQRLMRSQVRISAERNATLEGATLEVLIEGNNKATAKAREPMVSAGRSYRDAPDVDGTVIVRGLLPVGELARGRIIAASAHDLVGTPA